MKKIFIFTFLFLMTFQFGYSQQFNLTELLKMSKSQKQFEEIMISVGNDIVDKETGKNIYMYHTSISDKSLGGASILIPTRDKKMDRKYQFSDGTIISETELDSTYTADGIHNFLSSGKLTLVEGFKDYIYKPNLITYEIWITTTSTFAENYDRVEKKAFSFYEK